jgi:hypothetical protein
MQDKREEFNKDIEILKKNCSCEHEKLNDPNKKTQSEALLTE